MSIMRKTRLAWLGAILAGAGCAAAAAWAATVHDMHQYGRQFMLAKIAVARGDTIRFVNDDPFLHQIYVVSDTFNFDSDEQPPGQAIDVTWPIAGTFVVQCHIHPTMHLIVNVK